MPEQGGNRQAPAQLFGLEVQRGRVPGFSGIRKFGYNSSMSDSFSTVWPLDSSIPNYVYPQQSALLQVSSTSANDSGTSGTHARAVAITGLDSAFSKQVEVVTLAGASSVSTTNSFIRVNRVAVTSVGAYGNANEGGVTITTTSSDHILAYIPANEGVTQQLVYTVSSSETAYLTQLNFFPAAGKTGVDYRGRVRQNADVTDTSGTIATTITIGSVFDAETPDIIALPLPAVLGPKTDFEIQCENQGGATPAINTAVAASFVEVDS